MTQSAGVPWQPPTILEHIRAHLHPSGCGLLPGGRRLPGAESAAKDDRWALAGTDGVLPDLRNAPVQEPPTAVEEVLSLLARTIESNFAPDAFAALYERIRSLGSLWYVKPLLEAVDEAGLPLEGVHRVARTLAAEGRHVEPVKVGIALLGLCPGFDERDLLLTLGRSDELTLYCAVAIAKTEPDPEPVVWALARGVTGWGRIYTVRMLSTTQDPRIQDWIVREGFRNDAVEWHLATTAAVTGRLLERLRADPDDELVRSGADLVSRLVEGGYPQGLPIDEYPDAPDLLKTLLEVIENRPRLLHFVVLVIKEFLQEDDDWEDRYGEGWTPQRHGELLATCERITAQPSWHEFVASRLESADGREFYWAVRAAADIGLDSFEAQWRRIQRDPLTASWYPLMVLADESRIDQIIEFAERALPLEAMARGPLPMPPAGVGWAAHGVLRTIVSALGRFPGRGWALVVEALRAPDDRARWQAVQVLRAWPRDTWPAEAVPALEAAARSETGEQLRAQMRSALGAG